MQCLLLLSIHLLWWAAGAGLPVTPQPEGLHVGQGQLGGQGVQLGRQQGLHVEVVDVGEGVRGHHHLAGLAVVWTEFILDLCLHLEEWFT